MSIIDRIKARFAKNAPEPVDYIDWSKVPKGFDWVAVDSGNDQCPPFIWAHQEKPELRECSYFGGSWEGPHHVVDIEGAIIGPLPPWRKSLRKRPA